jgi:Protein of unknown function (DUF1344)
MRKLLVPLALVAALGVAGAASAATSVGAIQAINPGAMTVTLDDGSLYHFTNAKAFANFKVGDEVSINWEHAGTAMDANSISPQN